LITAIAGIPDALVISPMLGFTASGPIGGPFSPSSQSYLLTNQGSAPVAWAGGGAASWLTMTPASGILQPGAFTNVTVSMNTVASNLLTGLYTNVVEFSNITSALSHGIIYTVEVGQSLVQNGGFETGNFSDWTLVGHTSHRGTVYNAVESPATYPLAVHSGNYGAFLGDDELATLSQTLATTPGQTYLLSLWLDNPESGSGQEFLVNWNANGSSANTIFGLTNPPVFTWTNLQFIVFASGTSTTLQFESENVPDFFGLDDVSVTVLAPPQFGSAVAGATGVTLAWRAVQGLVYQVQYNMDLTTTNWINLGPPAVATSSTLTTLDTNSATSGSQRFYRLVLSP
jgi:hypothetical protein